MKYFFIAILALLSSSCVESVDEGLVSKGGITGSVSDQTTGDPVSTVNVVLSPGGRSTVTGSDGSFEFTELDAGNYMLTIKKEGYNPNTKEVEVVDGRMTQAFLLIERIPSVVTADRNELDFGSSYGVNTLSFNIVNNDYETLEWEIVNNCGWIESVTPMSGKLAHGKTGTIIVKINRDLLSDGENIAVLVLSTVGRGSTEVTVKATGVTKKTATLNTLDVSNITATTACFNGEIVYEGYPQYTERGFVYSEQAMPTVENTIARLTATITDSHKYACSVYGLELGKTYYVRAYAVNDIGTAYSSNQVSFITQAVGGAVEMVGVDDINLSQHSAVAHANITNVGDPAYSERGFVYSNVNTTPTIYNSVVTVAGSGTGTFDAKLENLERETTYYVRAYLKNEAGITYSEETKSFQTQESLPTVATLAATDEDKATHSVVFHGKITYAGDPTYSERGFVYSTEYEAPTTDDNKVVVTGSGLGEFEARVSGLSAEYKTYVRAYATNSKGTSYGETITVLDPDVFVIAASGIMVQKEDVGKEYWSSVNTLCENSIVGGFTDWRLPTIDELAVLYNMKEEIGGFVTNYYWSGTFSSYNYYYYINFSSGHKSDARGNSNTFRARCVRSIE